ncbi:MAG: hypothetical protein K2L16_08835 [Muribaculaceae bacterium]|nr:hypothetical protein [Muribaculaceae bacterium]
MTKWLRYIYYNVLSAVLLCAAGCGGSPSDRLDAALGLMQKRPDSAYAIVRGIDYNSLDEDSLKAKYILARAWANVRVGRSLVTDTLLDDVAQYYISAGDTSRWVTASWLLSGYDFGRGDTGSAIRRLEDMLPRIQSPELLWDTHIHLLEVAVNSDDSDRVGAYADWLLTHTNVPEQILRFAVAKAAARYMQGDSEGALAFLDSVIATGVSDRAAPETSGEFFCEYAEILDAAGHSRAAIAVLDSLDRHGAPVSDVERLSRRFARAQFYANSGNSARALSLLDSINHESTRSVFEVYASIAMLKAALQYRETGHFPAEMMHRVTKNMHRNYRFAQFDSTTAMESVMELNEDNLELKLQRQRLWLLVAGISILLIVCGVIVCFVLSRRKRRLVEAEERAETLERMLREAGNADDGNSAVADSDRLRAALLRQLGIFKTFAGTPTPQSREALRKISAVGNGGASIEQLVDWPEFYSMIDSLYDGFHAKLVDRYPDTFNDKEQQIIVLLKAGFSTKEIGVLTEQSSATIYTRKSVIRRKTETPENGDIIATLESR